MNSSTVNRYRESSSVTTPTKIDDLNNSSFAEDCALDAIARKLRLQHQREQNREARLIRCQQLEQTARDDNDDEDTPAKSHHVNTTNSLFLQKFLNGDIDLRSIEQRDLRRLLSELESKYKTLMITNSSMYNEKQALHSQIDAYKDLFDEHYESFNQVKRQFKDKCRDFDMQKQILINLDETNNRLKEVLTNCERLIEVHEFSFASLQESEGEDRLLLKDKLQRILNENHRQCQEINKLKSDLAEEHSRSNLLKEPISNGSHFHNENPPFERQKQLLREIDDLKNRLQKFEADSGSLHQENKRYEAQLARYKQQLDDAEQVEDELKQERRRLQRELRTARDELENERTRCELIQRENTRLRTLRQKNLINHPDDELLLLTNHFNDIQSTSPLEDSI